jgi:hypothetical protein
MLRSIGTGRRRVVTLVGSVGLMVLLAVAVIGPPMAVGQATRTWVSGVGDDANPCSRTAPCKTFAGAISKTANGGEINCLDPGGFGGVTITKSLTIKCQYTEGGVLVSGTNAIVINAAATDRVTLRGLDINGIGIGPQASLVGIKVIAAGTVQIFDTEIYRFKAGIDVASTTASATRVYIYNSHIHDNGVGVIVAPGNNSATAGNFATIRSSQIVDNRCNLVVAAFGTNGSTPDANTDCGAATNLSGINQLAVMSVFDSGIADALNTAALAKGSITKAILRLGSNAVTGSVNGVVLQDGAAFVSFGDNDINGNGPSAAPTTVVTHT